MKFLSFSFFRRRRAKRPPPDPAATGKPGRSETAGSSRSTNPSTASRSVDGVSAPPRRSARPRSEPKRPPSAGRQASQAGLQGIKPPASSDPSASSRPSSAPPAPSPEGSSSRSSNQPSVQSYRPSNSSARETTQKTTQKGPYETARESAQETTQEITQETTPETPQKTPPESAPASARTTSASVPEANPAEAGVRSAGRRSGRERSVRKRLTFRRITGWLAALALVVFIVLLITGFLRSSVRLAPIQTTDDLRDRMAQFVELKIMEKLADEPTPLAEVLELQGQWRVELALYAGGQERGRGMAEYQSEPRDPDSVEGRLLATPGEPLTRVLERAVEDLLSDRRTRGLSQNELKRARYVITLEAPRGESLVFVGYDGEGRELLDPARAITAVRELNTDDLERYLETGRQFLLRQAEHPAEHGFHKYLRLTRSEAREPVLHPVYSASIVYSLFSIYDLTGDRQVLDDLDDWGRFILRMQNHSEPHAGAFHYSYFYDAEPADGPTRITAPGGREVYIDEQGRRLRFVTGTSAKTIHTLLRLYQYTGQEKYLTAAKQAGDWLVTMQNDDGTLQPYAEYRGGWWRGTQESLLYQGQALSAWSRLYDATGQEGYHRAARLTAEHFARQAKQAGSEYVGDDYREPNPVSDAWIVRSWLDYYRATEESSYLDLALERSELILADQQTDREDLENFGQWPGSFSSSGIAWLSEVLSEVYHQCRVEELGDCGRYKEAVIRGLRWVTQHTYQTHNSYLLPRPAEAIGGVFWSAEDKYVRSDSVAHALNAYVRLLDTVEDGLLLSVPDRPYPEVLEQFRR